MGGSSFTRAGGEESDNVSVFASGESCSCRALSLQREPNDMWGVQGVLELAAYYTASTELGCKIMRPRCR